MSERSPSVTVVIAAYNAREVIERALLSVHDQTYPADQVLVVDDASVDDTCEMVERMASQWPALKLIRSGENGGPARARNIGLAAATAQWVAVLDADDAWEPDRLERIMAIATENAADYIADNQILYDAVAKRKGRIGFQADWDICSLTVRDLFLNDIVQSDALNYGLLKPVVRREFLAARGLRYRGDMRYGEDFFLTAELLLQGACAVLTSYPGYIYTTRIGEHSRQVNPFSQSRPRFDLLIAASDELETKYASSLSAEDRSAIHTRRNFLSLTHMANVARQFRKEGRYIGYVSYVLRHPNLLKLLLNRTVARLRTRQIAGQAAVTLDR